MNLEGQVIIEIALDRHRPDVRVALSQPDLINRLMRGKTPSDALEIIPSIFSLCGMAQLQAAQNALNAASDSNQPCIEQLATRQCLTDMESLRENALRVAMDWPRFLGEPIDRTHLRPLMRLLHDLQDVMCGPNVIQNVVDKSRHATQDALDVIARAESILENIIFAEPLDKWRQRHAPDLVSEWAAQSKTTAGRLLTHICISGWRDAGATRIIPLQPLSLEDVHDLLRKPASEPTPASLPQFTEAPETTLLARHVDDQRLSRPDAQMHRIAGLWQRLTARLIELAILPQRMRELIKGHTQPTRGRTAAPGIGLGEVSAARGQLAHLITLKQGRIADYRILPPTRWNFAHNGVATRALGQIVKVYSRDIEPLCEMTINAIDPCVSHKVRIH